jgi:competence protein ComGF
MPTKGEKVTRNESDEIIKFKMEEMRSRRDRRNSKGVHIMIH